jgi:hypothetical protein
VAPTTDQLRDPLQDRLTIAIEAIRKARLQIARSRTQKIQNYLLCMNCATAVAG